MRNLIFLGLIFSSIEVVNGMPVYCIHRMISGEIEKVYYGIDRGVFRRDSRNYSYRIDSNQKFFWYIDHDRKQYVKWDVAAIRTAEITMHDRGKGFNNTVSPLMFPNNTQWKIVSEVEISKKKSICGGTAKRLLLSNQQKETMHACARPLRKISNVKTVIKMIQDLPIKIRAYFDSNIEMSLMEAGWLPLLIKRNGRSVKTLRAYKTELPMPEFLPPKGYRQVNSIYPNLFQSWMIQAVSTP